jgi:hypothetical protein
VRNDTVVPGAPLLPRCTRITDKLMTQYRKLKYSTEDIIASIETYAREICNRDSNNDYKKHRFSFYEFIKQGNGLEKFITLTEQHHGINSGLE